METPATRILIVPASAPHANVISALHGSCFDDPWSPFTVRQVLGMPGAFGLLAVPEGYSVTETDLAGFVLVRLAAGGCEVLSLAVGEAWRGRGVGRALLDAAIDRARATGATVVFLEVAEDNPAAQRLYRKLGFSAVGRRDDYYKRRHGPAVAALTYSLPLAP
jgi:ribosomal-protein-alanine N-acetyltransferase